MVRSKAKKTRTKTLISFINIEIVISAAHQQNPIKRGGRKGDKSSLRRKDKLLRTLSTQRSLGSISVPPQNKSGADYATMPCASQTLDLSDYYIRELQRK